MDSTVATLERETARLFTTLDILVDPATPSECDGWTQAHVLTHLARNADGIARLVAAAVDGTGETMYASTDSRNVDIEAGADRALAELVDDVRQSADRLAEALPRLIGTDPERLVERTPGGVQVRAADLPVMRLREVVYHHTDLRAGFDFDDVEPDLVSAYLAREAASLSRRRRAPSLTLAPEGADRIDVAGGGTVVTGRPAALLRWLVRRKPSGVRTLDGAGLPELPRGR